MDEKKFPWLLRLLALNQISIPMLDTYVANKERILGIFNLDSESHLQQVSKKTLGIETPLACLKHLYDLKQQSGKRGIKRCFFLHKGKRIEISDKQLKSFIELKAGIPRVTYIQSSKEQRAKFLTFCIEHYRDGFKSYFIPTGSYPLILEQAKEICKYLIEIIETHEKRKLVRMQVEFMVDVKQKLWLSYLDYCQTAVEYEPIGRESIILKDISIKSRNSELLEIINELDSAKNAFQRRPTIIKKIEGMDKISEHIRIDSPESDFDSESSSSKEKLDDISLKIQPFQVKNSEKPKINKNYIELISKMRIIADNPNKKLFITDEEYKAEYKKISQYLSNQKTTNDWARKKTFEFQLKKTKSIRMTEAIKPSTSAGNLRGKFRGYTSRLDVLNLRFRPEKYMSEKQEILCPVLSSRKNLTSRKNLNKPISVFDPITPNSQITPRFEPSSNSFFTRFANAASTKL